MMPQVVPLLQDSDAGVRRSAVAVVGNLSEEERAALQDRVSEGVQLSSLAERRQEQVGEGPG